HYVVPHEGNDIYRLFNRLHRAGLGFSLLSDSVSRALGDGTMAPPGSVCVFNGDGLRKSAQVLQGLSLRAIGQSEDEFPKRQPLCQSVRLGVYQPWSPSMDEGWTRLVLDDHEF